MNNKLIYIIKFNPTLRVSTPRFEQIMGCDKTRGDNNPMFAQPATGVVSMSRRRRPTRSNTRQKKKKK